jgi:SWI/SNF-related matrix-associated actin-dependent regulator 1 of chromatin subfamily A
MPKVATMRDNHIIIRFIFPQSERQRFRDTLADVRTLEGRRWNPDERYWHCPLSPSNVEKLRDYGFRLAGELVEWYDKMMYKPKLENKLEIPGLRMMPYPFQFEGISFIDQREGRVLIADEMGLGKTAQTLAWLQMHPELRPVIVVVRASLKLNWAKEIRMWMPEGTRVQILSGRKNNVKLDTSAIIIINYDIMSDRIGEILKIRPKVAIIDECQDVRNTGGKRKKVQRTEAVKRLCKACEHVIGLSGTPIVNRPIEFYNILHFIEPAMFPTRWQFAHRYCNAKHTGFGWDFSGASNTTELHEKLNGVLMIRRLKSEVLKDLPEKTRSVVPFEIDNYSEYREAEDNFLDWLEETEGREKADRASFAQAFVKMEKLKQLAVEGKMQTMIQWVADFLETGEKLVVFATHIRTVDILMKEFADVAVRLDGATKQADRQKVVDRFQQDNRAKLIVGNLRVLGVGTTLTAASNVAFFEYSPVPGEHMQAEDRVHRIGQKDGVVVWYLVAVDTIEEKLVRLLEKKARVLGQILDGKVVGDTSVFNELLQQLRRRGR